MPLAPRPRPAFCFHNNDTVTSLSIAVPLIHARLALRQSTSAPVIPPLQKSPCCLPTQMPSALTGSLVSSLTSTVSSAASTPCSMGMWNCYSSPQPWLQFLKAGSSYRTLSGHLTCKLLSQAVFSLLFWHQYSLNAFVATYSLARLCLPLHKNEDAWSRDPLASPAGCFQHQDLAHLEG